MKNDINHVVCYSNNFTRTPSSPDLINTFVFILSDGLPYPAQSIQFTSILRMVLSVLEYPAHSTTGSSRAASTLHWQFSGSLHITLAVLEQPAHYTGSSRAACTLYWQFSSSLHIILVVLEQPAHSTGSTRAASTLYWQFSSSLQRICILQVSNI